MVPRWAPMVSKTVAETGVSADWLHSFQRCNVSVSLKGGWDTFQ